MGFLQESYKIPPIQVTATETQNQALIRIQISVHELLQEIDRVLVSFNKKDISLASHIDVIEVHGNGSITIRFDEKGEKALSKSDIWFAFSRSIHEKAVGRSWNIALTQKPIRVQLQSLEFYF